MKIHSAPSLTILPHQWTLSTRRKLRKRSGIYVYCLGNIPLYVGATKNLESRTATYYWNDGACSNRLLKIILKAEGDKIKTKIYFHPEKELVLAEQRYLEKIQPRLNQQNRKYNNQLRRKL